MTAQIPELDHAANDGNHVTDHNDICAVLTTLAGVQSVTWSTATPQLDASTGSVFVVTLEHSITGLTIINPPPVGTTSGGYPNASIAQDITLYIFQPGSGGPFSFPSSAWPAGVTWLSGSAPQINQATPGGLTVVTLETPNQGTTWYGTSADIPLPLPTGYGGTGLTQAGPAGTLLTSTGATSVPSWQGLLSLAAVQTSAYTAAAGQIVPVDTTGGAVTVSLPAAPPGGALCAVKMISMGTGNAVTVATGGTDVFNRTEGFTSGTSVATTASLSLQAQGMLLSYSPAGYAWPVTVTASSPVMTISSSTALFAVGQVIFLAGTAPSGLSMNQCYYVVSSSVAGSIFSFQVSATAAGTAITPGTAGSGVTAQIPGTWTVLADDLPLTQLATVFAQVANNLSDLKSASTARTNLGLGSAAVSSAGTFAQVANNLSDLASASTARTNLGLGAAALAGTPVPVASGGTNATTAAAALTSLGALPVAGGTMTGYLAPAAVVALTFGSSVAINAALGNVFSLALTASTATLAIPTNAVDGQAIRIRVAQPSSGGPYTLAYTTTGSGCFDFGAAGAPTLSAGASKVDVLGFEYNANLARWCYLGAGLGY